MYLEKESKLNIIKQYPLWLSQKESLFEQVKKYPCLFDKSKNKDKERDIVIKYMESRGIVIAPY